MLLVFLLRVGITVACEPHEFAELFGGQSTVIQVSVNTGDDQGELAEHGTDHCRQCNCHHGVALPALVTAARVLAESAVESMTIAPHANAPPERRLRPPIV